MEGEGGDKDESHLMREGGGRSVSVRLILVMPYMRSSQISKYQQLSLCAHMCR